MTNNTAIKLKHRNAYGRDWYDPQDRMGQLILAFADRKAFTPKDVQFIKDWGIQVIIVDEKTQQFNKSGFYDKNQ